MSNETLDLCPPLTSALRSCFNADTSEDIAWPDWPKGSKIFRSASRTCPRSRPVSPDQRPGPFRHLPQQLNHWPSPPQRQAPSTRGVYVLLDMNVRDASSAYGKRSAFLSQPLVACFVTPGQAFTRRLSQGLVDSIPTCMGAWGPVEISNDLLQVHYAN
jgi:hypothetical protein